MANRINLVGSGECGFRLVREPTQHSAGSHSLVHLWPVVNLLKGVIRYICLDMASGCLRRKPPGNGFLSLPPSLRVSNSPSSIPCGPRLGPSWAKLGPKWAPDGPDWGPFGNAAWELVTLSLTVCLALCPGQNPTPFVVL